MNESSNHFDDLVIQTVYIWFFYSIFISVFNNLYALKLLLNLIYLWFDQELQCFVDSWTPLCNSVPQAFLKSAPPKIVSHPAAI